jgi:hypothetical protein
MVYACMKIESGKKVIPFFTLIQLISTIVDSFYKLTGKMIINLYLNHEN